MHTNYSFKKSLPHSREKMGRSFYLALFPVCHVPTISMIRANKACILQFFMLYVMSKKHIKFRETNGFIIYTSSLKCVCTYSSM